MASVRELRKLLGVIIAVLLLTAVAAAVALFTPLAGSRAEREGTFRQVHRQYQQRVHDAIPLQHIDQKLAEASQQINSFYRQRFPKRDSDVAQELGRLAQESGVRFSGVRYSPGDTPIEGIDQLVMEASLAGDYARIVKFINALERDRMLFIVDSVTLGQEQGGAVRLQLKLETYLKGEA